MDHSTHPFSVLLFSCPPPSGRPIAHQPQTFSKLNRKCTRVLTPLHHLPQRSSTLLSPRTKLLLLLTFFSVCKCRPHLHHVPWDAWWVVIIIRQPVWWGLVERTRSLETRVEGKVLVAELVCCGESVDRGDESAVGAVGSVAGEVWVGGEGVESKDGEEEDAGEGFGCCVWHL